MSTFFYSSVNVLVITYYYKCLSSSRPLYLLFFNFATVNCASFFSNFWYQTKNRCVPRALFAEIFCQIVREYFTPPTTYFPISCPNRGIPSLQPTLKISAQLVFLFASLYLSLSLCVKFQFLNDCFAWSFCFTILFYQYISFLL